MPNRRGGADQSPSSFLPSCFAKWPGLVQPYSPSREICWEEVSLESDILMRFKDPRVVQEFRVYKHRELIQTLMPVVVFIGGFFFMASGQCQVGGLEYQSITYTSATLIAVCSAIDFYCFLTLNADEERSTRGGHDDEDEYHHSSPLPSCDTTIVIGDDDDDSEDKLEEAIILLSAPGQNRVQKATVRWFIGILAPFLGFIEATLTCGTWAYYDEHCRQTPDWAASLGLRASPASYYSDEQIHNYCTRVISPFSNTFEINFAPSIGAATLFLVPMYLFQGLMRGLAELRPREIAQNFPDAVSRALIMTIGIVIVFFLHGVRYRTSMHQFLQEIALRKAANSALKREEEVDTLLCNMMPLSVLDRLSNNLPVADFTEEATVLFSDIVAFTSWSSRRTPFQVVSMLNALTHDIDLQATKDRVEKIKTIGDAYWAVTGLPDPMSDHAERMCQFGNAMRGIVAAQNKRHPEWNDISLRIGIHSGPLSGGILGTQQLSYEVFGDTCTIAGKVEQAGTAGRVAVTAQTLECLDIPEKFWGNIVASFSYDPATKITEVVHASSLRSRTHEREEENENASFERDSSTNIEESTGSWIYNLYLLPRSKKDVVGAMRGGGGTHTMRTAPTASSFSSRSNRSTDGGSRKGGIGGGGPTSFSSRATPHDANSSIAASRKGWTAADAKKQRSDFLARRAANPIVALESGSSDETDSHRNSAPEVVDVERTISRTRYKYFFNEFADPMVEESFMVHLGDQLWELRIAVRMAFLVFLIAVLINIAISGGTFSLISGISFLLAGCCGILDLVLCLLLGKSDSGSRTWWSPYSSSSLFKVQAGFQILNSIFFLLAAGLMPPGASTGTNDVTYLLSMLCILLNQGNAGFVSGFTLSLVYSFVLFPLTIWLVWPTVMLASHIVFMVLNIATIVGFSIIAERLYRLQFLQCKRAEQYGDEKLSRAKEQEALLTSMVPLHTVKELMGWMETGMDPSKAIVQSLPVVVTCFVQIYMPSQQQKIEQQAHRRSSSALWKRKRSQLLLLRTHSSTLLGYPLETAPSPSPLIENNDNGLEARSPTFGLPGSLYSASSDAEDVLSGGRSGVESTTTTAAATTTTTTTDLLTASASASASAAEAADDSTPEPFLLSADGDNDYVALDRNHWLQDIHVQVDQVLKKFHSVVKIKTVGDTVMLAGPFDDEPLGLARAADDMLEAVCSIKKVVDIRAGIHCGELVGAVLGNSRLCYDIFGDTVNTASRVMTTSSSCGGVSVSEDYYQILPLRGVYEDSRVGDDGDGAVELGDANIAENADGGQRQQLRNHTAATTTKPKPLTSTPHENKYDVGGKEEEEEDERKNKETSWFSKKVEFSEVPVVVLAKGKESIFVRHVKNC